MHALELQKVLIKKVAVYALCSAMLWLKTFHNACSHLGAGHVWGYLTDTLLSHSRVGCIIDSSWPLILYEEMVINLTCNSHAQRSFQQCPDSLVFYQR